MVKRLIQNIYDETLLGFDTIPPKLCKTSFDINPLSSSVALI